MGTVCCRKTNCAQIVYRPCSFDSSAKGKVLIVSCYYRGSEGIFSRTKTVSERVNVAIKMLTESIKMLTQRIGIGDLLPGPPYLSRNFVRGQGLRWFWARLDFGLQTLPTESAFQVLSGHKAWARSVAQNQTVPNYLADRAPKNDRPCPVVR